MKLSKKLSNEITSLNEVEPNVLMFVDESAIFWVADGGYYIWMQDHSGIEDGDFIDETHQIEDRRPTMQNVEGVLNTGVYWLNSEFEARYHISDFTDRISEINATV